MKIHCKCTQEYKKNNGVEENIPLTKDILKQIRDHVFHYFIKATKVGESRLRCRKNNKIWTQEEKDSMAALLFRRMPKENACLIDIYCIIHILKGLFVWILTEGVLFCTSNVSTFP